MSSHLRVYARLRFIRVRWINSPLATRRFQVRIVSSKTRPGFLLKTRSSRCWVKSCAALSVTFSGPICRAQQYRPKRLKTVRSAGFAPDLQRSFQASVRGTLMSGTGRSAPVSLRARRTSLLILRQRAGDRRRAPGDARSNNVSRVRRDDQDETVCRGKAPSPSGCESRPANCRSSR